MSEINPQTYGLSSFSARIISGPNLHFANPPNYQESQFTSRVVVSRTPSYKIYADESLKNLDISPVELQMFCESADIPILNSSDLLLNDKRKLFYKANALRVLNHADTSLNPGCSNSNGSKVGDSAGNPSYAGSSTHPRRFASSLTEQQANEIDVTSLFGLFRLVLRVTDPVIVGKFDKRTKEQLREASGKLFLCTWLLYFLIKFQNKIDHLSNQHKLNFLRIIFDIVSMTKVDFDKKHPQAAHFRQVSLQSFKHEMSQLTVVPPSITGVVLTYSSDLGTTYTVEGLLRRVCAIEDRKLAQMFSRNVVLVREEFFRHICLLQYLYTK
ncbi:unnamed protein product [Ambrosiozyma monospora]|uniref:Unnamed protein product n=1 Tax=Ambrosiozyma monospora TaxID=43982 RepID=A0ACB5SZW0_AMBMO|nr:unnamed protein product [Ambrosiozyma monospora]